MVAPGRAKAARASIIRRIVGPALVAGALIAVGSAGAVPQTKNYAATVSPTAVGTGSRAALAITIANCGGTAMVGDCSPTSTQTLGSADVTIPAAFTQLQLGAPSRAGWSACLGDGFTCGAGANNVIQLRSASGAAIAAGQSVGLTLTATAPCSAATYALATNAKQSNDYSGPPGNGFIRAGGDPTVTVSASSAAVDHFTIAAPTGTVTAGAPFAPTITAVDSCNNTATGFTQNGVGTLTGNLSTSPGPSNAAPVYPGAVDFVNGTAQPSVTAYAAETDRTLTFSATGYSSVTTSGFTVSPAAPDHMRFTAQPLVGGKSSWLLKGASGSLTPFGAQVSIYDAYDNLATQANGNVGLVVNNPAGVSGTTLGGAPVAASAGVATFTGLTVDKSGVGFTLTAIYSGIAAAGDAMSDPFNVFLQLADCNGSCGIGQFNVDTNTTASVQANGSFLFLGVGSVGTGSTPAGCQTFDKIKTGTAPLLVIDQRSDLNGDLYVQYGISLTAIKKLYGSTRGQQFIPLCIGARRIALDAAGMKTVGVPCTADPGPAWVGKKLDANGFFDQTQVANAVCDAATGYWWGIIGSFQDYTNANKSLVIDPANNPTVSAWGTDATGKYRVFTVRFPAGSNSNGLNPALAAVPWDGWLTG